MQIEMTEFAGSGDGSADRRDDEEIPPANCVGKTLAHTVDCSGIPFPCGACISLAVCFAIAVCLSAWGINTYDIVGDVDPNIDGFIPRRTEIGNRINTATILFDRDADGFDGQLDKQCKLYNTCLSHRPVEIAAPVTPVGPGDRPTGGGECPPEACVDDPMGLLARAGSTCEQLLSYVPICDTDLHGPAQLIGVSIPEGLTAGIICPVSCGDCPAAGTESGQNAAGSGSGGKPAGPNSPGPSGEPSLPLASGCTPTALQTLCPELTPAMCSQTVAIVAQKAAPGLIDAPTMACIQQLTGGKHPEVLPTSSLAEFCPGVCPAGPGEGQGRRVLQDLSSVGHGNSANEYCTHDSGYCYTVIFDRKDGTSLYTAESFRSICQWEDDVRRYGLTHTDTDGMPFCQENPSGAAGCCIPQSVPRLVAEKAGTTCEQLTDEQIQTTLCNILGGSHDDHTYEVLVGGGPFGSGRLTAEAFGGLSAAAHGQCGNHEFDISSRAATSWLRSRVCTHNSGGSERGRKDFLTELWMNVGEPAFEDDAESQPVQATFRDHIEGEVNNKFVFKDLKWALFSFLLIFIYIALVTNSIYLATLGMTHIFLSFFCTYAIYKTAINWLAGVGWFPFLLWLGLFVICGIGADDIFVFVDAWRQSQVILPKSTPLANRISWVHHRASMAMLITSFTTACAFFSNTVNYVIPVGLFGAFMALLVVLNYVMVCTMFPAAVVVYHFFLEDRAWKNLLRWPLHGPGAGACCPPSIYAPPPLPPLLSALSRAVHELDDDPFTSGWSEPQRLDDDPFTSGWSEPQLRPVERFFESMFAPALFRLRNPVVGACTVFTLGILFGYTLQMEKETSKVNLWPQWYPMEVYRSANDEGWPDHYDTSFGCEPGCEDVYFIWGVEAIDDGNILDYDDHGRLHFDDKFSLTAESVAWLEGLMEALRGLSMFAPRAEENGKRSPLEALTHTDEAGQAAPLIPVSVVEMASYPVSQFGGGCGEGESQSWEECFNAYVRDAPARASCALRTMHQDAAAGQVQDLLEQLFDTFITYDESGELKTFSVVLHSTLDGTDDGKHGIWDYPVRTEQWEEIENVFNEHLKNAPVGWEKGFFLSFGFVGKDLQDSMQFSAIESGAIAVVLAFFTLLAFTDDLLMSGLASLAIVVTLILVIGWLVAIGWKLGVLESMCMAISVGICVDFICHHAHAYSHCDSNSRKERITHSLVEMGISVVSAAVTTFTAAFILLQFTTVTFFTKFGIFLAVCMICSIAVALVYFHALLAIAGPLGGGGGLRKQLTAAFNRLIGREHSSEVSATLVSADDGF